MTCNVPNCSECSQTNSNYCEQCTIPYSQQDGTCHQPCGQKTCAVDEICTSADNSTCQKCQANQLNVNGQCVCELNQTVTCEQPQVCSSTGSCSYCADSMHNCQECTAYNVCTKVTQACSPARCTMCENDPSKCTACESGYYVGDNSYCQLCSDILTNCLDCNSSITCTNCKAGFFLNDSGTCSACTETLKNCLECTKADQCTKSGPCTDPNCSNCSESASQCTECANGFTQVDSACLAVCGDINCPVDNICAENICTACRLNEQNVAGACKCKYDFSTACPATSLCEVDKAECELCSATMPNCAECTAINICTKVKTVCSEPNCTMCEDSDSKCTKCSSTYYLLSEKCKLCKEAMPNCSECSSDKICTKVDTACTKDNCAMCETDAAQCTECQSGYYASEGSCVKGCKDGNCKTCSKADTCTVCNDGYYLNASDASCVSCKISMPNCAICDSDTHCTQSIGKCLDPNCSVCAIDADDCTECDTGYTPLSDVCVLKCNNENCKICLSVDYCSTCKDGYYSSSGNCNTCPSAMPNCEKCKNETTCTKQIADCDTKDCKQCWNDKAACQACDDGFYLSSNACTSCTITMSNCSICTDAQTCTQQKDNCDNVNCKQCYNNKSVCQICNDGYKIKGDSCSKNSKDNSGMIIGIIAGVIVLLMIIASVVFWIVKNKKSSQKISTSNTQTVSSGINNAAGNQLFI